MSTVEEDLFILSDTDSVGKNRVFGGIVGNRHFLIPRYRDFAPSTRSALVRLEPISKLPTAVDRITMSNDSAQGRAVGANPGSFSGGENCRWTSWAQTDSDPLCARGAQWHMLPQSYPDYKTVHRRFQTWCRDEVLRRVLTDVANELRDRGALNEEECFIDATFVMAKGGGSEIGATKRGKGMKIMAIVDRHGLPLSVSTHAANHHEVL